MKKHIKQYHLNKIEIIAYKAGWNLARQHKANNYGNQIEKARKNAEKYTYYMWYVAGYEDFFVSN